MIIRSCRFPSDYLLVVYSADVAKPNNFVPAYNITLSCDRNSCQYIISSCHDCSYSALLQGFYYTWGLGLQFVFHNQQTKELEILLDIASLNCHRFLIVEVF